MSVGFRRIRNLLSDGKLESPPDEEFEERRFYLDHINQWFKYRVDEPSPLETLEELKLLRDEFPHYITETTYNFHSAEFVIWLLRIHEFSQARELLLGDDKIQINSSALYVAISECTDETFILEILQQPEHVKTLCSDEWICHQHHVLNAIQCGKMLVATTILSLGIPQSDLIYRDMIQDHPCRDLPTRLAWVNLFYRFNVRIDYNYYNNVIGSVPESELMLWLEWGLKHGAPRHGTEVYCATSCYGDKYLDWFHSHHFPVRYDTYWIDQSPSPNLQIFEQKSRNRISGLKKMKTLWCDIHSKIVSNALPSAIKSFDTALARYILDENNDACQQISSVHEIFEQFRHVSTHYVPSECVISMREWIVQHLSTQIQALWKKVAVDIGGSVAYISFADRRRYGRGNALAHQSYLYFRSKWNFIQEHCERYFRQERRNKRKANRRKKSEFLRRRDLRLQQDLGDDDYWD